MRKEEIPQDKSNLESANFRELCYAVDENGEYTTANSTGWDPKTIALDNAIKVIEERVADAKKRVSENKISPIEYYMELHKMDVGILASYVGFWQWRVKRHFKPSVFKKLSANTLQKYADVFEISIDELQHIKP
jgi:hypothetical protein